MPLVRLSRRCHCRCCWRCCRRCCLVHRGPALFAPAVASEYHPCTAGLHGSHRTLLHLLLVCSVGFAPWDDRLLAYAEECKCLHLRRVPAGAAGAGGEPPACVDLNAVDGEPWAAAAAAPAAATLQRLVGPVMAGHQRWGQLAALVAMDQPPTFPNSCPAVLCRSGGGAAGSAAAAAASGPDACCSGARWVAPVGAMQLAPVLAMLLDWAACHSPAGVHECLSGRAASLFSLAQLWRREWVAGGGG